MAVLSNRRKISAANYTSAREQEFYREADKLTADIKSLYDDYNTLYKQDSERGGGIDVYRPDSSAWYDNVSGLDSSLQAKADDILKRVEYYKSYLDPEYYKTLTSDIGNIKSNGSSILSNAQSMRDLYSNFKDEGEYMSWLDDYKKKTAREQEVMSYDRGELEKELAALSLKFDKPSLERKGVIISLLDEMDNINIGREADEILSNKDKYNSLYEQAQGYKNPIWFSEEKATSGQLNRANAPVVPNLIKQKSEDAQGALLSAEMTDDEKYVYSVLFAQDPQKAEEYYNSIKEILTARSMGHFEEGMRKVPIVRDMMAITTGIGAGIEGLGNLGKSAITGQPVERSVSADMSAYLMQIGAEQASDVANKIVSGGVNLIGKAHGEDWSEAGKKIGSAAGDASSVIYTATMSGLQSIASSALMGGADVSPLIRTIPMAASAFSSSYNEALDRGMSDGQALKHGIVNALIEWGAEAASSGMSALWAKGGEEVIKSTLGTWLKEIGVNFAEESLTEAASSIYDVVANGEYSNYQQMLADGMTPEESLIEITGGIGLAGLSGAIMGAEQMGVASIRNSYVQNKAVKSVKNQLTESGYNGDIKNTAKAIVKNANDIKLSGKETQAFGEYEAQRKRAQLNHNLDELNFTMGANGRKEADLLDIGNRDPLTVATAFAARYKQGVNGSSIGGFDTAKYAILSETEQKIAYNAGKMDAAQSLSKKTEGFRAEKQAKIDAENARIEAERQEAEAKKQKAIEAKEQATYKKMTPQMQENAEKYGLRKNGALAYAADYTGDKSDASIGKYTEDFIKAYNAGKKGTDISRVGLGSLTDGQRRRAYNAGKADIEQNAPKFSSADIKTTSGTTAGSTVKQGSTKILADNSKAVANEISKIESPKMRQYAKDFKLGENGVKTYATAYDKSQNEGVYTQDFVEAYNAGKNGKDISEVKASSLTEAQKKQAYNAGKMDAIKATVDDKKSRTKTFANGSKVVVADQTKLTAEQKNIIDNFAKAGIKVYLADIRTKNGDSANGLYDHGTGIIYLSTDPRKALQFLAKHELTHFIEKRVGKQQYFDLMNTIFDSETFKKWYEGKGFKSLTEMEANKVEEYRKGGIELNKEDKLGAKKEILADFVGEMLFGGKNQISDSLFSELDDNHKKTFREWISALIDRLKKLFSGNKTAENEITKLEAKFKEMLKESLKSEVKGEGVSASYGGEKAATADRMRLDTAKQMISDGVSPEQVRKETGWFKGYDGKWRFEIDDSRMEYSRNGFNPDYLRYKELELKFLEGTISDQELQELKNIPQDIKNINLYRLDQFVKHKELFAAYPELRRLKITFDSNLKGNGAFYRNAFLIKINPQAKNVKNTLLHEIQHAIQFSEGFAGGADVTNDVELKNRLYVLKQEQKKISQELEAIYKEIGFDEYSESLWEKAWNMEIDPDTIESLEEQFLAEKSRKGLALYNYQKQVIEMVKEAMREESNLYEQYFNTAGEIEARDVSNRAALDAEQRKNTRPDIDREDVVFADRNLVEYYAKDNPNEINNEIQSIKQQLNSHIEEINNMAAVSNINYKVISKEQSRKDAIELYRDKGFKIDRQNFGVIELGIKEIDLSSNYLNTSAEFAAWMTIPQVLKRGKLISGHSNHKNEGFSTYTIAAPVVINGVRGNIAVVVRKTGKLKYKTHRILMPDGSSFIYKNIDAEPTGSDILLIEKEKGPDISSASNKSISQGNDIVNTSDEKISIDSESSLSYTPADEQELTRMAQNGEISAEEYGRRMLEMRESKSADDIYAIARMSPEDMTTTPDIDRRKGEAKGDGESKFYGSIQRSSIFDETFKAEAKSDEFIRRYETITNKETLNKAAKLLDEGGEEFVKEWNNKEAIEMSPVDTAVGFILLSRYQDIGNYNSAIAVAEKLRKIGTVTGQNLQLFSITSRFDANMMQQWAQKELDKAFEEAVKGKAQKWIDKNKSKFELTEEDIDYIRTRTIQAAYLPNGSRDQAIRLTEISSRLQDKIPPNLGQSFKAWQRISMLLNPKTQIRNVLGNGVMVPAFIVSDWFGSAVDKAISKKTGVRTTGVAGLKATGENLKAVKQGMYESYDDFKRHINTKIDVLDRFSVGEGKSFNENKWGAIAKALNSMDRLTSFLLDFGDRPFYEAWFTNSLNNQMRLNNVTEPTLAMVEIAQEEALQRTWQDNNGMTQAVASIKKACNKLSLKKLGLDYGLGDVLVKFTKTPANLTKAIYDFSPAAAISIATKGKELSAAISTGRATAKMQKDFVNTIGKAAAGTLLYTLFGLLYAMGRISGRSDDDKDVSAFEKYVQGIPEYSVKMFGKWWSYDWSQPIGAVPAIVANFMESRQQGDDGIIKSIWEAIRAGGEVLFEQSFMKSFQILFTADSVVDGLIEAVVGEATVPIPTILSQTANVFDPYRRSTYDNRSEERTILNKVKQKIPGLRNTLEVERDILGRETPNSQKNWFNAFFNPANTYTDTSTAVTDHVYELYQSTGEASAIPSKAPYDVTIKGVKHTFSIEERNEYQRIMGETSAQIIGELLNNESYMALSDEQKLAVIKSVYSYSQSLAKSEMGLAESYDVISGIKDITEDEYNALSDAEIKAIADDYVLSSYYSISDFDNTKKATWFINKSLPSAINAAIKSGDMAKAQELIKSIEANIKSFGLPKKETNEMIKKSQSSIKSEITSYWKEKFIEAHKRGDNGEKIRIKQILVDTGLYGNSSDVRDLTNGWKKEK